MQKFRLFLQFILFIFISLGLLLNCATRKGPTGGPIDRTPPLLIKTVPARDSLQVPLYLKKIQLKFSERMEQSTLSRNVYISPPLEFEVEWQSWKEVDLNLLDSLISNQTYVISIASGVQDLRKNSMAASYQFAFSTGKELDSFSINGKVFGLAKDASVNLFAYLVEPAHAFRPDTLKPLYITKSGKNGTYRLAYMKQGLFRILAVQDQNNNLLLDADFENMGLPDRDVPLDSSHSEFSGLDFRLTKSDTTAPQALSVRSVYNDLLELRLTEAIQSTSIKFITISDSVNGQPLPIRAAYPDPEFKNILKIVTSVADSNRTYRLQASSLSDSSFNMMDSSVAFYFHPKAIQDTVKFKLLSHSPKDSSQQNQSNTEIHLQFSTPISRESLMRNYALKNNTGQTLTGDWTFTSLSAANFQPNNPFLPDSAYYSVFNLDSLVDLRGNLLADSINSYYFKIVSSRELGDISGKVEMGQHSPKPVILDLKAISKKQESYRITAQKSGAFHKYFIPDGKYILEGWLDEDENGLYSAGKLFPFQYAEPFSVLTDTIKVRKRWETENIIFKLPVPERVNGNPDSLYQNGSDRE